MCTGERRGWVLETELNLKTSICLLSKPIPISKGKVYGAQNIKHILVLDTSRTQDTKLLSYCNG